MSQTLGTDATRALPGAPALNKEPTNPSRELRLALITPARNESEFIEETMRSVIAQTVQPIRWIIVSDGSTDGTDDVVAKFAEQHDWIELVRVAERKERHFAGKAIAFRAGHARLSGLQYDVIGNLDADITLPEDCIELLLKRFAERPHLGVAGVARREHQLQFDYRFSNLDDPAGACQLFRRECFEAIGGYMALKGGGIDLVADITARMKGWQTRTFPEIICGHHRKTGSANRGVLAAAFESGRVDYLLGCDPLWQVVRSIYRVPTRHPIVLDGSLGLAGYLWGMASRAEKVLPPDLIQFRRREERRRLRAFIRKTLGLKSIQ